MTPVTDTKSPEQLINEAEQATDNTIDATAQIAANNANGATPNANGATVSRWEEDNHVFAQPHPAHELITCQTAYGRDMKDETGKIIDGRPDGFDRIMLPNLIPSGLLAEAERLCSMHKVDLRDEWRFAQLQMTQAIVNELSQRPTPADYKGETKRLSDSEREAKRVADEARKAEVERLRVEGKALREAQKAEIARIEAEFKAKMEAAGIAVPERKPRKAKTVSTEGATDSVPVADAPLADAPTAIPVTLVQPTGGTVLNGDNGATYAPVAEAAPVAPVAEAVAEPATSNVPNQPATETKPKTAKK